MTLKEFFVAVLAEFEADVSLRSANEGWEYSWHTGGMCDAVWQVAAKANLEYEAEVYTSARRLLDSYRPAGAGAYWFPVRKALDFDECVLPRRAILKAIIDSL